MNNAVTALLSEHQLEFLLTRHKDFLKSGTKDIEKRMSLKDVFVKDQIIDDKKFNRSIINNCRFEHCMFIGVDFTGVAFVNSTFINCAFDSCVFDSSYINLVNFRDCGFNLSRFNAVSARSSKFEDCHIDVCSFLVGDYKSVVFTGFKNGIFNTSFMLTLFNGAEITCNVFSSSFVDIRDRS